MMSVVQVTLVISSARIPIFALNAILKSGTKLTQIGTMRAKNNADKEEMTAEIVLNVIFPFLLKLLINANTAKTGTLQKRMFVSTPSDVERIVGLNRLLPFINKSRKASSVMEALKDSLKADEMKICFFIPNERMKSSEMQV